MPDHKTVLENLKKSQALIAHMGDDGKPLAAKVAKIVPVMERALQLRDGYKTAQSKLATLKKDVDEQSKKVDAAKAKNAELHTQHLAAAKEIEQWAVTAEKSSDLKDPKNKAINDAVGRLKVWSVSDLKAKFEYWDEESYQSLAKKLADKRKVLPKPDGSNKLPQDLGVLEGKVDAMTKQLQDAAKTAKAGNQIDKDFNTKKKSFDDMQAKVKPIEDALAKVIAEAGTGLGEAKELTAHIDHTGSKEAYQRFAAVSAALNDALGDYTANGAALDLKAWAAKP